MRTHRGILMIVSLALVLRLLACARLAVSDASLTTLPDQVEYLECGRNLLHGQGLNFFDPRFGQTVRAYRMPGYPLLIAGCGGNVIAIRMVQSLLDASTTIAVYLLARRWLSARAALLAAAIVAINPFQIYFCGLILSETLFIALLIWSMTLLPLPCIQGKGRGGGVGRAATLEEPLSPAYRGEGGLAALLLCASTLVRPSATFLPFVLAVLAPSHRIRQLLITLLIEALLLFAWAYRNHTVVGEWIITSTNSGISAYDGLHPGATGASDQTFIAAMPELKSMSETERNRYLAGKANTFVREHPFKALGLIPMKLARLWTPVPLSAEYGTDLKLIAIAALFMVPLYALTLVGMLFGQIPWGVKLFLLGPAVYFSLVHAVGVGSLRYRIPADVPMTIIAAAGAAALGRKSYGQASADTGKAL